MNHWLTLGCLSQIRRYLTGGRKPDTSRRAAEDVFNRRPVDRDQVHLVNLRMLLMSLLPYSRWSTGWTSITVTFTRLSSCRGETYPETRAMRQLRVKTCVQTMQSKNHAKSVLRLWKLMALELEIKPASAILSSFSFYPPQCQTRDKLFANRYLMCVSISHCIHHGTNHVNLQEGKIAPCHTMWFYVVSDCISISLVIFKRMNLFGPFWLHTFSHL